MSLIKRNGWNLSLECEENQYNRHERHARCEAVEEEVGEPVRAVTDAVKGGGAGARRTSSPSPERQRRRPRGPRARRRLAHTMNRMLFVSVLILAIFSVNEKGSG